MKKILQILTVLLFTIGLSNVNAQTQVITNGGFESYFSSWSYTTYWHWSTVIGNCGGSVAALTSDGNGVGVDYLDEFLTQNVNIPSGATNATFSICVKDLVSNNQNFNTDYLQFSVGGTYIGSYYPNGTNTYQTPSWNFNISSLAGQNVTFEIWAYSPSDGNWTKFYIDNVSLLVTVVNCTPVTVASQPNSQTVNTGNTATFSVSANGTPPFSYFWYTNGNFTTSTTNTNSTSNSYTTPTLTSGDNGNYYYCLITNCNSLDQVQSNNANLTVNTPCTAVTISSQPSSQTVNSGSTATFNVSVNGTPPFSYFWYTNGNFTTSTTNTNSTSNSYTTPILTSGDNGNYYYCLITNCNSLDQIQSNNANLTVNTACTAVSIGTQPSNQTSTVGGNATFSVSPNGTSPFTYQWYKNSVLISGATNSSYTTPTLILNDNGNTYYCVITNCSGSYTITSNNATLTVNSGCTAVSIGTQPTNQTSTVGGNATFSVSPNGTSPFVYQWYKNSVLISGATNSSYTTPTLILNDNGNTYYCVITNCSGSYTVTSNNATLTVNSGCTAVSIGTQPINQNSSVGGNATFSVSPNGTSPFTYQWYKNSVLISGATNSSYTTPTLILNDNGNTYYCVITNCSGSYTVTSNTATLTVTGSSIVVISPNGGENLTGGSSYNIVVSNSSDITQIDYYYSYDNGSNWYYISSINATPNTPTYPWLVSYVSTTFALVKVIGHTSNGNVQDVSNAVFNITVGCISTTEDYPYGNNPSFDCNANPVGDHWNFDQYSCTSWVAWKVNQEFGYNNPGGPYIFTNHYCFNYSQYVHLGDAGNWNSVLTSSPYYLNSDHTPTVGSIGWYDYNAPGIGQYGHVTFVNCVENGGDKVTLTEYNGSGLDSESPCLYGTRVIYLSQGDMAGNRIPTKFIHVEASGMGNGSSGIPNYSYIENTINIFPNPSSNKFSIKFESPQINPIQIKIMNVMGQIVYVENLGNYEGVFSKEYNLENESQGIYFVQITIGDKTFNKKLIIQK